MAADLGRDCIRVSFALLGEWWCVPKDLQHDEAQAMLVDLLSWSPAENVDLVTDRLFGGFVCPEYPERRHVYFSKADYTWCHPEANEALSCRRERWEELLRRNSDKPNPLDGPWSEDLPRELVPKPEGEEVH